MDTKLSLYPTFKQVLEKEGFKVSDSSWYQKGLNELGYIVDVIEYTDTKFILDRNYELFIGHGGHNFEHIASRLSNDTTKIYFSTGIYWKEFNRREAERFRDLEKRRGVLLSYDRWITRSEEYANRSVDAIICLGNEYARHSYSQFPLVLNVNNASYPDNHRSFPQRLYFAFRNLPQCYIFDLALLF